MLFKPPTRAISSKDAQVRTVRGPFAAHLSEVKSANSELYGKRDETGAREERPQEELPVVDSFPSDYSEEEDRSEKGGHIGNPEMKHFVSTGRILRQETPYAVIVAPGGIDSLENPLITADQHVKVHLRHEVY
jgi:hypothetical protein